MTISVRERRGMIKVALLLRRAASADYAAFAEEWIAAGAEAALRLESADGALRYAQNHALSAESPLAGAPPSPFDGVEEFWFDSVGSARRYFAADGHGLRSRAALDLSACLEVSGEVLPMFGGDPGREGPGVKIFVGGVRKPGLTVAEYRHLWIDLHGPLALADPAGTDHLRRLEYCPADDLSLTGLPVGPFDSTGSIWMESLDHLFAQLRSPYYRDVLGPDEARFNDRERSFAVVATERAVWDGRWRPAGPV